MEILRTIGLSAVLPAVLGALAGYWSQRFLMDRKARLDYEFNAKKRLYEVVGPLRFQMLVASRDVVRRVNQHHETDSWKLAVDEYYGRSTLYRILRPLAIATLVERETSFADFSVDDSGLDLIRFETAAYRILTGDDPLPFYDGLDWTMETQHVFRDHMRQAATCLVHVDNDGRAYVVDYGEFAATFPDPLKDPRLSGLANIVVKCGESLVNNPVFWTRLTGYAYVCNWYLGRAGAAAGFERRAFDAVAMLRATEDQQIRDNIGEFPHIFEAVIAEGI